ncbi:hypothetical protein N7453_010889 [Penicillium expansum]|nr:hypothetical protein N7453_010889 [Penicillium expansum]
MYSIKDAATYNESPKFNIKPSNESTNVSSSSKTPITTKSGTISPTGSAIITSTGSTGTSSQSESTATSTSSGAGSAATPILANPFAFVGAAAAGMLAF